MSLKRRLDKLEPDYAAAWTKAWERALSSDEIERLEVKVDAQRHKVAEFSKEELLKHDEAFQEDLTTYPVLETWDGDSLSLWLKELDKFLEARDFTWDRPDYSLWPNQLPEPPDVPQEVVRALRTAAYSYSDFAGEYAFYYQWSLIIERIRAAKLACQQVV